MCSTQNLDEFLLYTWSPGEAGSFLRIFHREAGSDFLDQESWVLPSLLVEPKGSCTVKFLPSPCQLSFTFSQGLGGRGVPGQRNLPLSIPLGPYAMVLLCVWLEDEGPQRAVFLTLEGESAREPLSSLVGPVKTPWQGSQSNLLQIAPSGWLPNPAAPTLQ